MIDEGPLRFLRTGAADGPDQTVIVRDAPARLEMPYLRPLALVLAARPSPERVLVIGLGGGGIVHYLRAAHTRAWVDAVEIDPVVARLAREHFGLAPEPGLAVHVADGAEFIKHASRTDSYDLVFVDAYHGDTIPPALAAAPFMARLPEILHRYGVAVANVGVRDRESFVRTFASVFQRCVALRARQDDNLLVVGSRGPSPTSRDLLTMARALDGRGSQEFRFETIARTLRPCAGSR